MKNSFDANIDINEGLVVSDTHAFRRNLKVVCNEFNERLSLLIHGNNTNCNPLNLGMPSNILLSSGLSYLPIQMSVRRLIDKKKQENHPFSLVSVVHLPEYIAYPLAVFQSKTRSGVKVIFTEMQHLDVNMVVAIEMNKTIGKIEINDIRSIYPKDNIKELLRWIAEDNLLEYCHNQKILDWLNKQQSNSAEVAKLIKDTTKVINSFQK